MINKNHQTEMEKLRNLSKRFKKWKLRYYRLNKSNLTCLYPSKKSSGTKKTRSVTSDSSTPKHWLSIQVNYYRYSMLCRSVKINLKKLCRITKI